MMPSGWSSRHPGRVLFASLALLANLIAAGVPVLHAWAHEAHAAAHAAYAPAHPAEHGHAPPASATAGGDDHHADAAHPPARPTAHEHPPLAPAAAGDDDPHHDAAHPPALHEDCLLVHRAALTLVFAPPAARLELLSFVADDVPAVHPVSPVPSRAPPSAAHARAPPLA